MNEMSIEVRKSNEWLNVSYTGGGLPLLNGANFVGVSAYTITRDHEA